MKKSILNLKGVNELSKSAQQSINGGCANNPSGPPGTGRCYYKPGCYTWVDCNLDCPNGTQPICAWVD